jgi:hypothetical protein
MNEQQFNLPTPAEAERLELLAEEAAEVIQMVMKIQRHGYESYHPENPGTSNRQLLEKEIGHFLFAMRFMQQRSDIRGKVIYEHQVMKHHNINQWLHHNQVSEHFYDETTK